jgi:hypothetical protein
LSAPARSRGIRATKIPATYGERFKGRPTGGIEQERAWPRTGVEGIGSDAVPARVANAAYEAALLELQTPGSLAAVVTAGQRIVRARVEGAVDVSFSDEGGALEAAVPVVSTIEGLLAPLLKRPAPAILVV